MNRVYGLALHEFSAAQVDRAPAPQVRILSETQIFSLYHARDMLIISLSQYINNLETKKTYKRTVNLTNIIFLKKFLTSVLKIIRGFV